jgi:hypothetical protein
MFFYLVFKGIFNQFLNFEIYMYIYHICEYIYIYIYIIWALNRGQFPYKWLWDYAGYNFLKP